jgi:hypothetical protein
MLFSAASIQVDENRCVPGLIGLERLIVRRALALHHRTNETHYVLAGVLVCGVLGGRSIWRSDRREL